VSELLIGYGELSSQLGVSRGRLRQWRHRGKLPPPDAPGPRWRPSTLFGLPAHPADVAAEQSPERSDGHAERARVVVTVTVEVSVDGR
jgi:MerR HTH family regulatory protein